MKPKTISILILGVVFSGIGLYFSFRNIPIHSLMTYAAQVDPVWLLPGLASLAASYAIRAMRWRTILTPFRTVKVASAYHALIIGFMLNCILPGRIGEIARPAVLSRRERIPFLTGLSTLAAERLLDLAALLALLALTSSLAPAESQTVAFGPYTLDQAMLFRIVRHTALLALLLLAAVLLIGWAPFAAGLTRLIRLTVRKSSYLGPRFHQFFDNLTERYIVRAIQHFAAGLGIVQHPLQLFAAGAMSLAVWALNALAFLWVAWSCPGINLTYIEITMVMVVICLFIALPSVPGYWGLWEAAGLFALTRLGVPETPAAGYTLFNHAFQILPVLLAGWFSCLMLGFRWSRLTADLKSHGA